MKYDLEERLITFAVSATRITEDLPDNRIANHLAGQLIRSSTAPALVYGEAQSAESRKDFVHKMKVALKELRETKVCLRMIKELRYLRSVEKIENALGSNHELIAIFVKSIATAKKNLEKEQT